MYGGGGARARGCVCGRLGACLGACAGWRACARCVCVVRVRRVREASACRAWLSRCGRVLGWLGLTCAVRVVHDVHVGPVGSARIGCRVRLTDRASSPGGGWLS